MSEPAKKRYCENLTYDTVLSAFEQLNAQIESHYSSSSKLIHEEGLKYLERLTKQYLRLKGRQTQGEGENCH